MASPEIDDSPRMHLGRFELVYRLDVGGMAEIFLALERAEHHVEHAVARALALREELGSASRRSVQPHDQREVEHLEQTRIRVRG